MSELETVLVDINSIQQDPKNANTHSVDQLQYIAKSLDRFSQQKPIVVGKDNIIIAGNGTHLAAKEILGWTKIAVVYSNLSNEEARAFGLADNQIARQSEWEFDTLTQHIKELSEWDPLQDWQAIGFEKDFINPVVNGDEEEVNSAMKEFLESDSKSDDRPMMAKPIKLTEDQRFIVDQTVNIVRIQEGDPTLSEGRIVELVMADYLSGLSPQNDSDE